MQLGSAAAWRRTSAAGGRGCITSSAVCKDQQHSLPTVRAAHAHVVGTAGGDLPPCRHAARLITVVDSGLIIHFRKMQRHVEVFVALRGGRMGMGALGEAHS